MVILLQKVFPTFERALVAEMNCFDIWSLEMATEVRNEMQKKRVIGVQTNKFNRYTSCQFGRSVWHVGQLENN